MPEDEDSLLKGQTACSVRRIGADTYRLLSTVFFVFFCFHAFSRACEAATTKIGWNVAQIWKHVWSIALVASCWGKCGTLLRMETQNVQLARAGDIFPCSLQVSSLAWQDCNHWFGRAWRIIPSKNTDERTGDGKKKVSSLCMFFALWLQFPVPKAHFNNYFFWIHKRQQIRANCWNQRCAPRNEIAVWIQNPAPCIWRCHGASYCCSALHQYFFWRNCALVGLVLPKFALEGSAGSMAPTGADLTTNQTEYFKFEYIFVST